MHFRHHRSVVWLALAAGLVSAFLVMPAQVAQHVVTLIDPQLPIEEVWQQQSFGEPTRYRLRGIDGRSVIEAAGEASAAGLFRDVDLVVAEYPIVEWTWRVDRLPEKADLRSEEADDVGASVYFIFGRPGFFGSQPPTLAYAWTGAATPEGSVVVSPRHPGTLRVIVLQSGTANLGRWVVERRNLIEDYRRAFGEDPPKRVEAIAIWSDSDQTGESVQAFYGRMLALPQP